MKTTQPTESSPAPLPSKPIFYSTQDNPYARETFLSSPPPYYLTAPHYLKELVPLATTVALSRAAELTADPVLADHLFSVEHAMFRLRDYLSGRPVRSDPSIPHWTPLKEQKPDVGAVIACTALHFTGASMYWAGKVVEIDGPHVTIELLRETISRITLTSDTSWILLPSP